MAIYIISFFIGLILVAVGATDAGSFDPTEFSEHTDNGVAQIVWGGAFFSLAITAAMVHLGAAAVLWRLQRDKS